MRRLSRLIPFLLVVFCGQKTPVKASLQQNNTNTISQPLFIKHGDKYTVTSRHALDLHERLPTATYTVGMDPMSGEYYLQRIDPFPLAAKIYGDTAAHATRILTTALDRPTSTGVLLTGEKGSGKTFLAKYISVMAAAQHDMPTVVINQPLFGERFNKFIQSIHQPVVFLFDEFEKIYADDNAGHGELVRMQMEYEGMYDEERGRRRSSLPNRNQDSMLTLLDGTYPSQMLFILTTNDKYRVSNHMKNRPGRIYYGT